MMSDLIRSKATDGSTALFSGCGKYRYLLARARSGGDLLVANLFSWRATKPTEIAAADDPVGPNCNHMLYLAARSAWVGGYTSFVMLNPSTADAFKDDPTIRSCLRLAEVLPRGILIAAWGASGPKRLMAGRVAEFLCQTHLADAEIPRTSGDRSRGRTIYCLGETKEGHPRHPLFLPAEAGILRPWRLLVPPNATLAAQRR